MLAPRLSILAILCLAVALGGQPPERDNTPAPSVKPRFAIAKETTYFTAPLDKDGYVDYVAALNAHFSKGVTPSNNANLLLWQAIGPKPEATAEYFRLLGVDPPAEKGDYLVDLYSFLQQRFKIDADKLGDNFYQLEDRL